MINMICFDMICFDMMIMLCFGYDDYDMFWYGDNDIFRYDDNIYMHDVCDLVIISNKRRYEDMISYEMSRCMSQFNKVKLRF